MRFLGIDYGEKKLGLALSDSAGRVAFPHDLLPNNHSALATLQTLCAREVVGEIVIGRSLKLAGGENETVARGAKALAEKLGALTGLKVNWSDERYSSAEARAPGGAAALDARAAAVMLQRHLDWRGAGK